MTEIYLTVDSCLDLNLSIKLEQRLIEVSIVFNFLWCLNVFNFFVKYFVN